MNHRRNSSSDVVHVRTTNDPPPANSFPNSVWATEDDYSRVSAVITTDDTKSPSKKKTRSSSSEIGNSFFKTKLCFKFNAGTCPYAASSCHFAHSVEELRLLPPPPNRQDTAEERPEISSENGGLYKGRHCKKFVHDEASRNRESFAISLGSHGYGVASDGSNVAQILKPPNWKTRICNKWEITGYCPFGSNCNFAHGASG